MLRSLRWFTPLIVVVALPCLATATVKTLPITQVWQHKDTLMQCTAPGGNALIHAWDHAVNPAPGDPHCGYYCAPASIAMYALYVGRTGVQVQQDQIYDHGKFVQGETLGDGIIQTHGVGMFDAVSPTGIGGNEVQTAFAWAIAPPVLWGPNYGAPQLTGTDLIAHIQGGVPILWVDHYGYPAGINPELPQEFLEVNGHAKIIAGYDDAGTPATGDDLYFIYDPWPSSGSPYWAAQASVLDARDLYITRINVIPVEESSFSKLKATFQR